MHATEVTAVYPAELAARMARASHPHRRGWRVLLPTWAALPVGWQTPTHPTRHARRDGRPGPTGRVGSTLARLQLGCRNGPRKWRSRPRYRSAKWRRSIHGCAYQATWTAADHAEGPHGRRWDTPVFRVPGGGGKVPQATGGGSGCPGRRPIRGCPALVARIGEAIPLGGATRRRAVGWTARAVARVRPRARAEACNSCWGWDT
jgi:hypothetical protein